MSEPKHATGACPVPLPAISSLWEMQRRDYERQRRQRRQRLRTWGTPPTCLFGTQAQRPARQPWRLSRGREQPKPISEIDIWFLLPFPCSTSYAYRARRYQWRSPHPSPMGYLRSHNRPDQALSHGYPNLSTPHLCFSSSHCTKTCQFSAKAGTQSSHTAFRDS